MDDPQSGEVRVPVPDDYDEDERAAFLEGFAACADLFGTAAASYKAAVSRDDDAGDDGDVTDCRTCGSDLLDSMGADESDHSPDGRVCPECDL